MIIKIRVATEKDIPAILEIINYEILNSTIIYDYEERNIRQQLEWFHNKEKENMPVLVAEIEAQVIGFATFGIFRPWAAYQFSIEHSIYIHKDNRGLGVGKKLMVELIEIAQKRNYHTIIAERLFHKYFVRSNKFLITNKLEKSKNKKSCKFVYSSQNTN